MVRRVRVYTQSVELAALLKWAKVVGSGGEAKRLIQEGQVRVNGVVERHRSRRLVSGDRVEVGADTVEVVHEHGPAREVNRA